MTPLRLYTAPAVGVAVIALGACVILGWLADSEPMVRVVPGSAAVGINTAVLLMAAGTCLLRLARAQPGWWCAAGATLLIVLPVAVLIENLTQVDLGIDWATSHAFVDDGSPQPGRMSLNASIGFVAAGIALLLATRFNDRPVLARAAPVLALVTLAIGLTALLGYALGLETLYRVAIHNRTPIPTAIALSLIGIGLWVGLRQRAWLTTRASVAEPDRHITRIAVMVLTGLALTAGLTGFVVLKQGLERWMSDRTLSFTKNTATVMAHMINQSLLLAQTVAAHPTLQRVLAQSSTAYRDPAARHLVLEIGASFKSAGLTGLHFLDASGRLVTTGTMARFRAAMVVDLPHTEGAAQLLWNDGFVLLSKADVLQRGTPIGAVVVEQRLPALTRMYREIQQTGGSSDLLLCGRDAADALCFPTRFNGANTRIAMHDDGQPNLPIDRALRGQNGITITKDLRGVAVLAAFAPVGDTGLGITFKTDVVELYAPIRERLNLVLALLATLVGLGTLFLRAQVQPIARRLVSEQRRMNTILQTSHEAFVEIDQTGRITDWNAEAERTFGWSRSEAMGRDMADLILPPAFRDPHRRGMERFIATGTGPLVNKRVELSTLHRSGRAFTVEATISDVSGDGGRRFAAFMHDISERKLAENRLHHQATHDTLTGLPYRSELMSRLEQAMKRAQRAKKPMALLFLDMDGFKRINDTFGHEAGDQLLKAFAQRLCEAVRKTDTVARLGGDEFTIVAENLSDAERDAGAVAEKILQAMATPFSVGGRDHIVTTSIGLALYCDQAETADALLARADGAMYLSKQGGKNRFSLAPFASG